MSKITKSELEKLCNRIADNLDIAYEQLEKLSNSYNTLMRGDGEAYWNGNLAKSFYHTAKNNLNNDIDAYVQAYEAWNKLKNRYENVNNADSNKRKSNKSSGTIVWKDGTW